MHTYPAGNSGLIRPLTPCFVIQQVDHVKAERNVLAEVHNPYVVKLFYSFQVGRYSKHGSACIMSHVCRAIHIVC